MTLLPIKAYNKNHSDEIHSAALFIMCRPEPVYKLRFPEVVLPGMELATSSSSVHSVNRWIAEVVNIFNTGNYGKEYSRYRILKY